MKNNKSYTALFSLFLSLLITWVILFVLNAISPTEGDHWTHLFVRRGISPMLSLFFGIYSILMIRHVAVRYRELLPYARLLLLFCLFPAGIGIAGSTLTRRDFDEKAAMVEAKAAEENLPAIQQAHQKQRDKIRQPLMIGVSVTLIDIVFFLIALQWTRGKSMKVRDDV